MSLGQPTYTRTTVDLFIFCWAQSTQRGHVEPGHIYLTILLLGRLSPSTSIVHILLPETDNCPSWISGRERMTTENISWSNLHERMVHSKNKSNHLVYSVLSLVLIGKPRYKLCGFVL